MNRDTRPRLLLKIDPQADAPKSRRFRVRGPGFDGQCRAHELMHPARFETAIFRKTFRVGRPVLYQLPARCHERGHWTTVLNGSLETARRAG